MGLKLTQVNTTLTYCALSTSAGSPCYPPVNNYSMVTHSSVVARLDPEHRLKPTDLLTHCTNRANQYEYVLSPGFWEKYDEYDTWCGTVGRFVHRYRRQVGTRVYYETPSCSLPAWQNDWRAQVANLRMNLAEYSAEYRETCSMFVDTAKAVDSAWADFRNGQWRKLGRRVTPKMVASAELQYRYGVRPLVQDLEQALILLNGNLNRPLRRRVSSRSQDWAEKETVGSYGGSVRSRTDRKARVQGYIQVDPDLSDFNPGTPQEALWAGLRFSFVFDWFIDVGQWLKNMDALRGITVLGGTVVDEQTTVSRDDRLPALGYTCIRPTAYFRRDYSRSVLDYSAIPLPTLAYRPSRSWQRVKAMVEILQANQKGKWRRPLK